MYAAFIALSLATVALANPFITNPIASTTCAAGSQCEIDWKDDGNSPNLTAFSPANIGLWVGNAKQQTQVQAIATNVDVSNVSSIVFTPDPTVGANGNFYFVRFDSQSAKDPSNPANPAQAFSAKFTLSGMTGTFSAAVQSQIDGQSTAPLGGATSAISGGTSSSVPASTTAAAASSKASSATSSGTAKATTTTKPNSASKLNTVGAAGVLGLVAAVFGVAF